MPNASPGTNAEVKPFEFEHRDTLHRLPLSDLPLTTRALDSACLVKTNKLETMVELFGEADTGKAFILPEKIHQHYSIDDPTDRRLLTMVGQLTSFDVFSLRVELRRLNIEIEDIDALSLSPELKSDLDDNMKDFLEPLFRSIFAGDEPSDTSLTSILESLSNPDAHKVRANLQQMAKKLEIPITEIPVFLKDYADTYLALAYFDYQLKEIYPRLSDLLATLQLIQISPLETGGASFGQQCNEISSRFTAAFRFVSGSLQRFKNDTNGMWENISRIEFEAMKKLINDYLTRIGATLCTLSVKIDHWEQTFPPGAKIKGQKYSAYLSSQLIVGLDDLASMRE